MASGNIELEISADDEGVAYLTLPHHPGRGKSGASSKQVRLHDLIKYPGPDIYFDFDKNGHLIGIEILT